MRNLFDNRPRTHDNSVSSKQLSIASEGLSEREESHFIDNFHDIPGSQSNLDSAVQSTEVPDLSRTSPWTTSSSSPKSDVVDRGVLSMEEATHLYDIYNTHLVPHYPVVLFDPALTAQELRNSKPTLFLAVVAAAAGKVDPQRYSVLNSEVLSDYAHRTNINSEKSLELVQAMIVTCVWYFPRGKFSQLKFYEYIHMAVVMAVEIGLGTDPRSSRERRDGDSEQLLGLSDADLEKRRTFLACYMISTG